MQQWIHVGNLQRHHPLCHGYSGPCARVKLRMQHTPSWWPGWGMIDSPQTMGFCSLNFSGVSFMNDMIMIPTYTDLYLGKLPWSQAPVPEPEPAPEPMPPMPVPEVVDRRSLGGSPKIAQNPLVTWGMLYVVGWCCMWMVVFVVGNIWAHWWPHYPSCEVNL